jgi:hypothetical protein
MLLDNRLFYVDHIDYINPYNRDYPKGKDIAKVVKDKSDILKILEDEGINILENLEIETLLNTLRVTYRNPDTTTIDLTIWRIVKDATELDINTLLI